MTEKMKALQIIIDRIITELREIKILCELHASRPTVENDISIFFSQDKEAQKLSLSQAEKLFEEVLNVAKLHHLGLGTFYDFDRYLKSLSYVSKHGYNPIAYSIEGQIEYGLRFKSGLVTLKEISDSFKINQSKIKFTGFVN